MRFDLDKESAKLVLWWGSGKGKVRSDKSVLADNNVGENSVDGSQ